MTPLNSASSDTTNTSVSTPVENVIDTEISGEVETEIEAATAEEVPGFEQFELSPEIMKAMGEMGFTTPTEIQLKSLPILLGDSHDFIGLASTGTGKTAAFGIPLVERIDSSTKNTQALVLSPTRELALQVADQLTKLGKHKGVRVVTIYGGASYRTQIEGVKRGAHIIVATPGRLVDFISQKMTRLDQVQTVVLDEADEMISMGFKDDLETILKATHSGESASGRAACKTWLFSATMSSDIRRVADLYLEKPQTVQIAKSAGISSTVEQVYYTVKNSNKTEVIGRILQTLPNFYGIIFCQTKMEVVELTDALNRRGFMADSLHGDRNQREREVTLKKFRNRDVQVVVATDVAARGLDIKDLTHVVNHSLPWDTESYVHRIGRTARNGQKGVAITLVNPEQLRQLRRVQLSTRAQMTKGKIPTGDDVARLKVMEVWTKLQGIAADNSTLKRSRHLVEAQELDLSAFDLKEFLARLIAADHPEVFAIKNEQLLDFVGDRIPSELQPGGGRSRPPVGASSGGRDYGPRSYGGGGFRGRRDYDRPRRDFDRPRAEDGAEAPVRRRKNDNGYDEAPARPRRAYGEDSAPRREYDRPRRSFGDRPASSEDSRPRREYGARSSSGEDSRPRRDYGDDSRPKREFGARSASSTGEGSRTPYAKRREDPKGVTRFRPGKKKTFRD